MTLPPLLAIAKGIRARPRKAKAPRPKEIELHMAVADVLRRYAKPDWRWSHFPSGEFRDKRTGAKLKAMGLQPGWPDFVLLDLTGRMYALELKRVGEKLTDEQEDFQAWCDDHIVPYAVARTTEAALKVLIRWGAIRIKLAAMFGERAEATS